MRRLRRRAPRFRYKGLRIPPLAAAIVIALFASFILGGGIYDIVDNPPSIIPGPGGWIAIHPYMSEQTLNESLLAMLFYFLSFLGLYLGYQASRVSYDRRRAATYLFLGIGLILLSISGLYYLYFLKRSLL
ncbi:MAG TPA: hypothetical protein ENF89_01135 [Candidatus Bathyarchaeota archaeon]|nr:hypothetical protein [Candidatus Bathyarchaeota archaeon]